MYRLLKKTIKLLSLANPINLLLVSLIFTIPSNLFFTFLEKTAFVRGLQVDYLIPKIYVSDLLLITLFFILLIHKKKKAVALQQFKKLQKKYAFLILFFLIICVQLTSTHSLVALLYFLRIIILTSIAVILIQVKQTIKSTYVYFAIASTVLFQSLLAWYQFLSQKSLLGYYFFGETNLSSYIGIAKSSLFGIQKNLPYGTTAHPNILAGILLVFVLFLMQKKFKDHVSTKLNFILVLLAVSTIVLTQSVSAILGLCIGVILLLLKYQKFVKPHLFKKVHKIKLKHFLLLFFIASISSILALNFSAQSTFKKNSSVTRRTNLNTAAILMFIDHPIAGVGLQNFTQQLEKYSSNQETVRFVQPVHNVMLLFLAETGLLGVLLVATFPYPCIKKHSVIVHSEYALALLPIALLDHYLITLQSGILLVFIVVVIAHTTARE